MKSFEQLVKEYYEPAPGADLSSLLFEMVEESIAIDVSSGQQNERNLVNTINAFVKEAGEPIPLILGSLGKVMVAGAASIGGGNPEPKADIVIQVEGGDNVGISMKKENFAFLENWMDRNKLDLRLQQVGMEKGEADFVVENILDALKKLTLEEASKIKAEKEELLAMALSNDPSYTFPEPLDPTQFKGAWLTSKGKPRSPHKIANYYARLSDILGPAYESFLRIVVGGGEENLHPADGILVANVPASVDTLSELQVILLKIKSVQQVVDYYKNEEAINIRFRLRPMTLARTTYSRTNRGKYKVGERLYSDDDLGVSWTVSVTK